MMRVLRFRLLAALVLALTACDGCKSAEPPDNYSVERMTDPYDKVPAKGAVSNLERAVAVVDLASKQLGYGDVPARVLRQRGTEGWAQGLVWLLALGTTENLRLAWEGLLHNVVTTQAMPADLKFATRQAEGRVNDYMALKQPEDVMRREYVAEISWVLFLLSRVTPDAGVK